MIASFSEGIIVVLAQIDIYTGNITEEYTLPFSYPEKIKIENKNSLKNISDDYSLLAIQGPKAIEAMQSLTSVNLSEIPFYKFKIGEVERPIYDSCKELGMRDQKAIEITNPIRAQGEQTCFIKSCEKSVTSKKA